MTKRERQLNSMLNYFEISTGGLKDETMTKAERKKFTDSINAAYDGAVIDELISKIKGKVDGEIPNEDQFFDGEPEEDNSDFFPEDPSASLGDRHLNPKQKKSPEIEEFLNWLSGLLYSADHKVTVTTDKNGTTRIKMEQIKKGGKK